MQLLADPYAEEVNDEDEDPLEEEDGVVEHQQVAADGAHQQSDGQQPVQRPVQQQKDGKSRPVEAIRVGEVAQRKVDLPVEEGEVAPSKAAHLQPADVLIELEYLDEGSQLNGDAQHAQQQQCIGAQIHRDDVLTRGGQEKHQLGPVLLLE